MVYTEDEVDTLVILNVVASLLSFLGASFIIANFFAFDEFRTNFAFKLILFVAIGDVINSIGNFMGSPEDGTFLCGAQAFCTQFGDITSFGWVTAIAWTIYNVIRREEPPTRELVEKWYKRIHFVIWPVTLLLSILPMTTGSYGNDNGLCWITFSPSPAGEIWRMICFYVPLWGSIVYVGFVYGRIWNQLHAPEPERQNSTQALPSIPKNVASGSNVDPDGKTNNVDEVDPVIRPSSSDVLDEHGRGNSSTGNVIAGYQPSTTDVTNAHQPSEEDNKTPKSGGGTLQRIKFYPFVLFGCYFFATIRRVAEWADEDHVAPFWIAACQVFTSALLGTCNAILYGFTPTVRKKDSEWVKKTCCGGGDVSFEKASSIQIDERNEQNQSG
eukprot:246176_1